MEHIALNLQSEWLLRSIVEKQNHQIAEFTWHMPSEFTGDEIILQCNLSNHDFQYLNRYRKDLELKNNVRVKMDAEYIGFATSYSGQSPECPRHIVILEAVIKHIEAVCIEVVNQSQCRKTELFFAA